MQILAGPTANSGRNTKDLLLARPCGFLITELGGVARDPVALHFHELEDPAQRRRVARGYQVRANTESVQGRALFRVFADAIFAQIAAGHDGRIPVAPLIEDAPDALAQLYDVARIEPDAAKVLR